MSDSYNRARDIATVLLKQEQNPTEELIRERAQMAVQTAVALGGNVDLEALVTDLLQSFSIFVAKSSALDDTRGHVPWLPEKRTKIKWRFWRRYETYLEQEVGMPLPVVRSIDTRTDAILERLEDPERDAPWDRRGMVVGSVQSGKTGNYIGLICKAIDAGYKLIVILAGLHNNLRSQTQLRLDEGVLGFDTQKSRKLNQDSRWIGVGKLPLPRMIVHSLTSSADDGDFNKRVAQGIGVMIGGDPVVLVVKKNSRLMENLIDWVLHVAGQKNEAGELIVRDVPLLLIDDEADNASINTKRQKPGEEDEATAINKRIRSLLKAFQKSAYVGYTATPFANIFINPDAMSGKLGDDVFPRSFILNMPPPSNYVGPSRVFGLDGDPDAGIEAQDGLPITRIVKDYEEALPPRHKLDWEPPHLPATLQKAIRCFVLVCAARHARGQGGKHNSMLIHVTRFVQVQASVRDLVHEHLRYLQDRIANDDGRKHRELIAELETLWKEEFVPVSRQLAPAEGEVTPWVRVYEALHEAAGKIEVKEINGHAPDALDYFDHPEGRSVIAIGGDKLSRGLTLEGLSVSYFLRTSRMYDTLMQMGRWFGYRPGYLDLCRLFTTAELVRWYRHIALAEVELRREFDYMVAGGLTPERYGLRVRSHSEGLLVTALNKMTHAKKLELSYAGELIQTAHFSPQEKVIRNNFIEAAEFLSGLPGRPIPRKAKDDRITAWLWKNVPAEKITKDFLQQQEIHSDCMRFDSSRLTQFIGAQTRNGELERWTVVLVSNSQAKKEQRRVLADLEVGMVVRSVEQGGTNGFSLTKANVLSPGDQALDLTLLKMDDALLAQLATKKDLEADFPFLQECRGRSLDDVALELTNRRLADGRLTGEAPAKVPHGRVVRELRPASHGLLMLYAVQPTGEGAPSLPEDAAVLAFAMSFPTSDNAQKVEYRVGVVWQKMLQDEEYEDE